MSAWPTWQQVLSWLAAGASLHRTSHPYVQVGAQQHEVHPNTMRKLRHADLVAPAPGANPERPATFILTSAGREAAARCEAERPDALVCSDCGEPVPDAEPGDSPGCPYNGGRQAVAITRHEYRRRGVGRREALAW